MTITPLSIAENLIGLKEVPGQKDNPFIVWCLSNVGIKDAHDEIAWCAALAKSIFILCGLADKKMTAAARSFLLVGIPINIEDFVCTGFEVVILKRGGGDQPGKEVINAQGHVGFPKKIEGDQILVVGGNQADSISEAWFPLDRVLEIRRIYI